MGAQEKTRSDVTVSVKNLGGIESDSFTLEQGVNLLTGPNSTNKTSTLRSISAALGSDMARVKSDAEEGEVELVMGDERYTRVVTREGGDSRADGEPYIDEGDSSTAELFAFLLESNEARLAIERGDDLRDIIMEPVDTDDIRDRINDLISEREELKRRIQDVESRKDDLSDLESERRELRETLASKRERLEEVSEEIDAGEDEISSVKERRSRLDSLIERRSGVEDDIESLKSRIEAERESISSLEQELEAKREELERATPEGGVESLSEEIESREREIERLEAVRNELDDVLSELQNVVEFNNRMLEDGDIMRELESGAGTEGSDAGDKDPSNKTDVLVQDSVLCWTCGTEVSPESIEDMLDRISDLRSSKNARVNEVVRDIESYRDERDELEGEIDRIESLEEEVEKGEEEIERRKRRMEGLEEDLKEKERGLEEVEAEIDEVESEMREAGSQALDAHRRKRELEVEIDSISEDIEEVDSEIEDIEDEIEEISELEDRLDEIENDISEERGRIDRLEDDAVESFNEHMDELLSLLEYENLERIWIEPRDTERKEGRRKVEESVFDLNIVRKDDDGNVYTDSVRNLSESEKELAGLVFALAGYLAHEVYEDLPFMIIDSLGALDAERLEDLLGYFEDYIPYLVAAVLPEVSESLEGRYNVLNTN